MKAVIKDEFIYVTFYYDPKLVEFMRTFFPRRFDKPTKTWIIRNLPINIKALREKGFKIYGEQKRTEKKELNLWFPKEAFNFQKAGIKAMVKHKRVLLADDMGLGKSLQAIISVKNLKAYPCLIICPATLKFNWRNEINKWDPDKKVTIINGRENINIPDSDYYVVNYEILHSNLGILFEKNIVSVIIDEAHYIKNEEAIRTEAVYKIVKGKRINTIFALTGTPILNRPIEIFNTLRLLRPDIFNNKWQFAKMFCGLKHNGFGWDFSGASNTDHLHKLLIATVMIRRRKKDVLKELPDKLRSVIPVEISNRDEYDFAERSFIAWLKKTENRVVYNSEKLVKIEKLKQLAVKGKYKQIVNWINDFLETGKKLVVFATHINTIEYLSNIYKEKSVVIYGKTSQKERERAVDRFQNDDKIKLIIGNLKAMGTGLTLTAASDCLFVELGWTPSEHDQAEDRIHRIGQKDDKVNIYYIVGHDTIEEQIIELLDSKREVIEKIIDGKKAQFSMLSMLVDSLLKKKGLKK